jgi:hypothetical protein
VVRVRNHNSKNVFYTVIHVIYNYNYIYISAAVIRRVFSKNKYLNIEYKLTIYWDIFPLKEHRLF